MPHSFMFVISPLISVSTKNQHWFLYSILFSFSALINLKNKLNKVRQTFSIFIQNAESSCKAVTLGQKITNLESFVFFLLGCCNFCYFSFQIVNKLKLKVIIHQFTYVGVKTQSLHIDSNQRPFCTAQPGFKLGQVFLHLAFKSPVPPCSLEPRGIWFHSGQPDLAGLKSGVDWFVCCGDWYRDESSSRLFQRSCQTLDSR